MRFAGAAASVAIVALAALTSSVAGATEPWVDPDPEKLPERYEIGAIGVSADAEYRAQWTFVNPIALSSEQNRNFNQIEHRGRFGATIDWQKKVMLSASFDVLDGVLWGDNGTFGGDPSSDSGLQVTTRDPNVVKPCVRLLDPEHALEPGGYGYGLCDADPVRVRRLYAQVNTPVGALRVGRQPVNVGMSVQTTDGDGRRNRFGVSYEGDSVDRVLFATKPLEILAPKEQRDLSEERGFFTIVMYDRWASDTVQIYGDDVHQVATAVRWLVPDSGVGSAGRFRGGELTVFYAHRWNHQYTTRVNTVGGRLYAHFGDFSVGIDNAANVGTTQEVAQAYSLITNDPVEPQQILQYGARFVARYDQPRWGAYLELDYASGDGDPSPRTPLSQFRFSEDTNVGLLLFEHVVRHQSAMAAAAGTEIIRRLGAVTFPAERVHTRGAFTNAFAVFPQVDFRPHETVLLRGGVLVAWAPEVLVDPVASLQAKDGQELADDLLNFVGGKPGTFYGTEIDVRCQWRLYDHFALDLEGAVLFPGDALKDVNGRAVNSFLTQVRTTFFF